MVLFTICHYFLILAKAVLSFFWQLLLQLKIFDEILIFKAMKWFQINTPMTVGQTIDFFGPIIYFCCFAPDIRRVIYCILAVVYFIFIVSGINIVFSSFEYPYQLFSYKR